MTASVPTPVAPIEPKAAMVAAGTLALGAAVAPGLSSFAYGLLLPAMQAEFGWNFAEAGAIHTANAVGAVVGALLAAFVIRLLSFTLVFVFGMFATGVLLIATGLAHDYVWLIALRAAAGLTGALTFIAGATVISRLAKRAPVLPGRLIGTYYSGVGLGILGTALVLPFLVASNGYGWRNSWLLLGLSAALIAGLAQSTMRRLEKTMPDEAQTFGSTPGLTLGEYGTYGFGLASCVLYGTGFIGYMTFVIALLQQHGIPTWQLAIFWAVLGTGGIVASRLWAGMIERMRGGRAFAVLNSVTLIAAALPILTNSPVVMLVSAFLFGVSFVSIAAVSTALVQRTAPERSWPALIAMFTICIAIGQCIGPWAMGWIADRAASLTQGFTGLLWVIAVAIAFALAQREPAEPRVSL